MKSDRNWPGNGSVTGQIRFRARNHEGRTSAPETFFPVVLDVKEASRWTACDIFPPRNL